MKFIRPCGGCGGDETPPEEGSGEEKPAPEEETPTE